MKRTPLLSVLRAGLLFVALPLASLACLQSGRFPPAQPPLLLDEVALAARKAEMLKFEPIKIDALLAAGLPGHPAPKPLAPPATSVAPGAEEEKQAYVRYVQEVEAKPTAHASFADQTDYAVALVHLGRTADAIRILRTLETTAPGAYTTAVNLGTAYELAGNVGEAAKWIAAGLERNPKSHEGTEWLHLAILRAKLALQRDAAWLEHHSVLDAADPHDATETMHAIEYQLGERLHFVQPKDAVVCDLFYQAAVRTGEAGAPARRDFFAQESRRFGDWRKSELVSLAKL